MPDELENEEPASTPEQDAEDEELELEDTEEDSEELEDAAEGDEGEDGDDDAAVEQTPAPVTLSGKALLDALVSDPEAKQMLASTVQSLRLSQEQQAVTAREAEEFQALIDAGDYATVGQKVVQKAQLEQARAQVAEDILRAEYAPHYAELLAQPELKGDALTAEEKLALAPSNFPNDASYIRALERHVTTKRFNATMEAEVTRRIAERDKAAKNDKSAGKASRAVVAASPGSLGGTTGKRSSADLIRSGLRATFLADQSDDDDD